MITNQFNVSSEDVHTVQQAIKSKEQMKELVARFSYKEPLSMTENIKAIAEDLIATFKLQRGTAQSLIEFLTEDNLPIEVTLKPLRIQHLAHMLSEWVSHCSEYSFSHQRLYTVNHRNSLFKTLFIEQRTTIDDYFSTLSQSSMLISDDVFNLLQDILAPYFLYEYDEDRLTFFEKENAILRFKAVATAFANDDRRFLLGPHSQKFEYIRRFQFEKLIQFWEFSNKQLTLELTLRRSIKEAAIQTDLSTSNNIEMQTDLQHFTLLDLLNSTLFNLTHLARLDQQDTHLLDVRQRMCSFLRQEKIALLRVQQQPGQINMPSSTKTQPNTQKFNFMISKEVFESKQGIFHISSAETPKIFTQKRNLSSQQNILFKKDMIVPNSQIKNYTHNFRQIVKGIYEHYRQGGPLTLNKFQKFLNQIKVIGKGQKMLTNNLIKEGIIKNLFNLSEAQFTYSLQHILQNGYGLNFDLLDQFRKNLKNMHKQQRFDRHRPHKYLYSSYYL